MNHPSNDDDRRRTLRGDEAQREKSLRQKRGCAIALVGFGLGLRSCDYVFRASFAGRNGSIVEILGLAAFLAALGGIGLMFGLPLTRRKKQR